MPKKSTDLESWKRYAACKAKMLETTSRPELIHYMQSKFGLSVKRIDQLQKKVKDEWKEAAFVAQHPDAGERALARLDEDRVLFKRNKAFAQLAQVDIYLTDRALGKVKESHDINVTSGPCLACENRAKLFNEGLPRLTPTEQATFAYLSAKLEGRPTARMLPEETGASPAGDLEGPGRGDTGEAVQGSEEEPEDE